MEKVLVCVLNSTRAHQFTFPDFKRHVLDELNADLALALAVDETYDTANPFWRQAKYRWTTREFDDYGEAYDLAQRELCQQRGVAAPDWRVLLRIKGIWLGGIRSPDPQPSAAAILPFCRWLLLNGLQRDNVLDRYDRFVLTRSDFVWLCPHPPLSILDRDAIWVPEQEDYGGLNDRHLVVSRADVVNCLNVIEDILLKPEQLYDEMKHGDGWNAEQFLAHHLGRKHLLHKVKRFPYVMYLARWAHDESPTWSSGRYEPIAGHYVKYDGEFRTARAYAGIIRRRADWENPSWMQFDPSVPFTLRRRVRHACNRAYHSIRSALRRVRFSARTSG